MDNMYIDWELCIYLSTVGTTALLNKLSERYLSKEFNYFRAQVDQIFKVYGGPGRNYVFNKTETTYQLCAPYLNIISTGV